jgi:prephenate dehydratase
MTTYSVAYQGEPGAWGEQAAIDLFGANASPVPLATFDDVFAQVTAGTVEYGVVPLENSLGGAIHRNYDLLMRHSLHVVSEVIVPIHWCLITWPNVNAADLRVVMSHWQALAQCERSLGRLLPNAQRREVYDTAGSVKMLKESGAKDTAALAGRRAAQLYDLPVLMEGLEDEATNFTRFALLSRQPSVPAPLQRDEAPNKTSIVFTVKHMPGSLFRALAAFSLRDIDLAKIESRPLQSAPWEYLFYVDFAGRADDENCARALSHLAEMTLTLRVLGSYPKAIVNSAGLTQNPG